MPSTFVVDSARDLEHDRLLRLRPREADRAAAGGGFVLRSEGNVVASDGGLATIPRPAAPGRTYDLASLEVFGEDGARLERGVDFDVLVNQRTGGLTARLVS